MTCPPQPTIHPSIHFFICRSFTPPSLPPSPLQIPTTNYTASRPLALPKLNLQFLTPVDYLLRNFHLFRLEAAYEVREDLQEALSRVGPALDAEGSTVFKGWSRMALPTSSFKVTEVRPPKLGNLKPGAVHAEVVIDTRGLRGDARSQWDEVRQHDVVYMLTGRSGEGQRDAGQTQ